MNASLHIIYKKLIAGLLLALFVFIYAEKVLHTHENPAVNTEQKGFSIGLNNNNGCAICDFTLAKDAALPAPVTIDIPIAILFKEYNNSPVTYSYVSAAVFSNRGPPVELA